ncbi:PIN domain-containing protein [Arthrobacter bambusae]|uniref:PIN domain-containing protein n=1 Tax=Arthrobacter TaxID=1663 RepID=UPI001F509AAC|nr:MULTISPECIES: PIN domain-containing protein [Arthrobacter]MCI0142435.1 PIN domain-containing protein [Arthrobacter bambusae]UYY81192.1 PIN domain-containing protein [Arthrobacter sp. YA7-1]
MTAFLLDSNALVLAMTRPEQLSSTARSIIEDLENRTFASAASAYELAYKYSRAAVEGSTLVMSDRVLQEFRLVSTIW